MPPATRTTRTRSLKVRPAAVPKADPADLRGFPPPTATSEQLAVDNYLLAMDRANRFAAITRWPIDELEAAAWVGLLNACRRYDPNRLNPATGRPYALSTVAVLFIDGAMRRLLRDQGSVAGVKFPFSWRDQAPRARRLAAEGKSVQQIAAEVGMDPADVVEMLHAMSATPDELDEGLVGQADEELFEAEGDDFMLQQLCRVAVAAFDRLHPGDREAFEAWAEDPRRRGHLPGQVAQFRRQAEAMLRRTRLPERMVQLGLQVPVQLLPVDQRQQTGPRRRSSPRNLTIRAEQLGLL